MWLNLILVVVLALSGVFMVALSRLVASDWHRRYQVRQDRGHKIPGAEHRRMRVLSSIVSTAMVLALPNLFHDALFVDAARPLWRMAFEVVGILALYDVGYYLLHRFVLHAWSPGSRVHAVHHRIRTPYVMDSLYVHPSETALGVGLLLGCTWVVGPVSVFSFGVTFLVYSLLNLFIHSAFHLPFFPFRGLSSLSAHHDAHHASMKGGYYGSITPLWDILFRTAR
jgi:sterol desaturase/sphingolipid hydroxylase (fatty acid hydroxylase superfamily)